jgi:hypothetical protein
VIAIESNDPAVPSARIPVRWSEWRAIALEPEAADIGSLRRGQTVDLNVMVTRARSPKLENLKVESRSPSVRYSWIPADAGSSLEDGSLIRSILLLHLDPSLDPERRSLELIIRTEDDSYHARLPVTWSVGPPIQVIPRAILQSDVLPLQSVPVRLIVKALGPARPGIRGVEVDGSSVKATIEDVGSNEGSIHKVVELSVRSGSKAGIDEHSIRLEMSGDAADYVTVPVTFFVKEMREHEVSGR